MTQSPSPQSSELPSYLQIPITIPAKLEQQLAQYPLGERLEVYKTGGSRALAAAFALVMIGISIGSFLLLSNILITNGNIPAILLAIPIFSVFITGMAIGMAIKGRLTICAYNEGLVYARNGSVKILPWPSITSFQKKTKKSSVSGTMRIFTIRTHDGKTFRIKGNYLQVDDLGKIISEKTA
jgi:hypothetical protein